MTGPLVLAVSLAVLPLQVPSEPSSQDLFETLASEFIGFHLYFNPVMASSLGATGYDNRLPDLGRAALQARAQAYQAWLDRLYGIDSSTLQGDAAVDYVLLERALRTQLLELTEIRPWERDPGYYVDLLDRAFVPLIRSSHGPARQRMNDLTARMRQAATVLAEAQSNLSEAPALFTGRAIDGARGLATVVRAEAEAAFTGVDAGPGKDDFLRAVAQTAGSLDAFADFLESELLPRSTGTVSLGPQRTEWLIRYREHVTDDVRTVLARLDTAIETERGRLDAAAIALDPSRRTAEVAADLASRTLEPAAAHAAADTTMEAARGFTFRTLFVTVPSAEKPDLRIRDPHTPWATGVMLVPGPMSLDDGPAEVTVLGPSDGVGPGAAWAGTAVLALGFPGAFVEAMYARRAPTRLRKALHRSPSPGAWGFSATGALLAGSFEGVTGLRVAGHAQRLQALAEARAALQIHALGVSLDDARAQLERDALLTPLQATASVGRAAHQPLARGVLGALTITDLRAAFLSESDDEGERTERRFHDALLASGLPPALAGEVLLAR